MGRVSAPTVAQGVPAPGEHAGYASYGATSQLFRICSPALRLRFLSQRKMWPFPFCGVDSKGRRLPRGLLPSRILWKVTLSLASSDPSMPEETGLLVRFLRMHLKRVRWAQALHQVPQQKR